MRGRVLQERALRIAHYFAMARREARMGQKAVADALGITIHTLSRYENGKVPISEEVARQLATLYRVDLEGWRSPVEVALGHEVQLPRPAREVDRADTFARSDPRYWSARWDQAVSSLRAVLREHEALADEMRDEVWSAFRTPMVPPRGRPPLTPDAEYAPGLEELAEAPPDLTEADEGEAERQAHG